jgi:Domain of unknown function (DU1801)
MRPTGADVEEFLAAIPDADRQADARTLVSLLSDITGEAPAMWGTSIVGFSPRKANLVIYLISGFADRHHRLLARLGPHVTGKGCLYVKRLTDIDVDVLRELVDQSIRVRRSADRATRLR